MFNNKGFTLIELLVVVLIIGILASVALPQYEKAVEKSRVAGVWPILSSLVKAGEIARYNGETGNLNLEELDIQLPNTTSCSAEDCDVTCPSKNWANCNYTVWIDGSKTRAYFSFNKGSDFYHLTLTNTGTQCCDGNNCAQFGNLTITPVSVCN